MQVKNPATGAVLATMPVMNSNETRAAIAAAQTVFPEWRKHTAKERSTILKRCAVHTPKLFDSAAGALGAGLEQPVLNAAFLMHDMRCGSAH